MALQFFSCKPKYTFLSSLLLLLLLSSSVAELSFNFYAGSCPGAELIVRNTVRSASSSDPSVLGKLLRLIFHDCFVQVHYILTGLPLPCITRHFQFNEIFVLVIAVLGLWWLSVDSRKRYRAKRPWECVSRRIRCDRKRQKYPRNLLSRHSLLCWYTCSCRKRCSRSCKNFIKTHIHKKCLYIWIT